MGSESRLIELAGGYEFADCIGAYLARLSSAALACALMHQVQNDAPRGIVLSRVCLDDGRGGGLVGCDRYWNVSRETLWRFEHSAHGSY